MVQATLVANMEVRNDWGLGAGALDRLKSSESRFNCPGNLVGHSRTQSCNTAIARTADAEGTMPRCDIFFRSSSEVLTLIIDCPKAVGH